METLVLEAGIALVWELRNAVLSQILQGQILVLDFSGWLDEVLLARLDGWFGRVHECFSEQLGYFGITPATSWQALYSQHKPLKSR